MEVGPQRGVRAGMVVMVRGEGESGRCESVEVRWCVRMYYSSLGTTYTYVCLLIEQLAGVCRTLLRSDEER